jgi:hypothetical protein
MKQKKKTGAVIHSLSGGDFTPDAPTPARDNWFD